MKQKEMKQNEMKWNKTKLNEKCCYIHGAYIIVGDTNNKPGKLIN